MTWNDMFARAAQYYNEHGNLDIPISYVCPDGIKLGVWLNTQRAVNNGLRPGILDENRKRLLNDIGIDWYPNETAWNRAYDELLTYYKINNNINVPLRYVSESGFKLGLWLQNQRRSYLKKGRGALSEEKIDRLNCLGIVWVPHDKQWDETYALLRKYYEEHGNIEIPPDYFVEGIDLYRWLGTQIQSYRGNGKGIITQRQIELLEELNVSWDNKLDARWDEMFSLAEQYYQENGHLIMLQNFLTERGEQLGAWVFYQRSLWRSGRLPKERETKLTNIGMVWNYVSPQQTSFAEQSILYYFKQIFPDTESRYKALGFELDVYIPNINVAIEYDGQAFHKEKMKDIKKNHRCSSCGIRLFRIREVECPILDGSSCDIYLSENSIQGLENAIRELLITLEVNVNSGFVDINRDSGAIYNQYLFFPVKSQRNNSLLSVEWRNYYLSAREYFDTYGHLSLSRNETYGEVELGKWLSNQRHYYNSKVVAFPEEKIVLLNEIGMIWNKIEARWWDNYAIARSYYEEFGHLLPSNSEEYKGVQLGAWLGLQRQKMKNPKKYGLLTSAQTGKLNEIEMVWDVLEFNWNRMYEIAMKYYHRNNNLQVPYNCVYMGEKLGKWIAEQRKRYKHRHVQFLSEERIHKLEDIGMLWSISVENRRVPSNEERWNEMLNRVKHIIETEGRINIPKRYVDIDGVCIGSWVYRQRRVYEGKEKGRLLKHQIEKLKKIGIIR